MQINKHFRLIEFTNSEAALRHGIDNSPDDAQIENIRFIADELLLPARLAVGPIVILSGFRCPELNRLIGGSPRSQHCDGLAADIKAVGYGTFNLFRWFVHNLSGAYDQLILEFHTPGVDGSGWVHVSGRPRGEPRGEALTAVKKDGSVIYSRYSEAGT